MRLAVVLAVVRDLADAVAPAAGALEGDRRFVLVGDRELVHGCRSVPAHSRAEGPRARYTSRGYGTSTSTDRASLKNRSRPSTSSGGDCTMNARTPAATWPR